MLKHRSLSLVDTLLSAVLVAFLWSDIGQAISDHSYEVDLISPQEGGRYRVNRDHGIAVIVAVQNKGAANQYGWLFRWEARSAEVTETGSSKFVSSGSIGSNDLIWDNKYNIGDDNDLYIALTHQDLSSDKPSNDPMPEGEYVFSWMVGTGPTCWQNTDRSRGFSVVGDRLAEGSLNLSIVDDASWPELEPTACASFAAHASFSAVQSSIVSWVHPTTTALLCGMREMVTETADPCRATVGPEQARSISSIMSWVQRASVTGGTAETSTTETTGVGASKTDSSSSSSLHPCFAILFLLL